MSLARALLGLLLVPGLVYAQARDIKVREDRKQFADSKDWIYNNLDEGIEAARAADRPLFVVFRCIPCEACQEFDDDVARRDPIIRDLLDQYVCVRLVQANRMDLTRFQFDYDQSFAAFLMHPDGTILARFATRSDRPESDDIRLEGLREAMQEGLRLHRDFDRVRPSLAGKQPRPVRFASPEQYPSLSGRYGPTIDYEGKTAQSCMHCHQIRDAERDDYLAGGRPMPDEVLYPYPDPERLGLKMDPTRMATVQAVRPGSIADAAGLKPGDAIAALDGQPMLSTADIQWVLHNAPDPARLPAQVRRGEQTMDVTLELPEGWRVGNIAWRVSSWNLRRVALGGLRLDDLSDDERRAAGLGADAMALKVRHVGQYGPHARAKRSGFRQGDILVSFDGKADRMTESDLLAYGVRRVQPGQAVEAVEAVVLRDGVRQPLTLLPAPPGDRD